MRKILVISTTRSTPKEVWSDARTWGELKDALVQDYGDVSKMRAVVKETKVDLAANEAELPSGDFTLFLSPKQIKAGNNVDIVNVLQALKDRWNTSIDEIIEDIEDGDYDEDEDPEPTPSRNHGSSRSSGGAIISSEDAAFLRKLQQEG